MIDAPGSGRESGARGSGPARTENPTATSATVRPSGPCTDSVEKPSAAGKVGTRPGLGRSPTTPQNAAGLRSEPPMSEPSATATMPVASAAATPPLDPPALRVGSCGLRVGPNSGLVVCEPAANSGTLILPTRTAPGVAHPGHYQLVLGGHQVAVDGGAERGAHARGEVGVLVGRR